MDRIETMLHVASIPSVSRDLDHRSIPTKERRPQRTRVVRHPTMRPSTARR
jgi:hypothetical protein